LEWLKVVESSWWRDTEGFVILAAWVLNFRKLSIGCWNKLGFRCWPVCQQKTLILVFSKSYILFKTQAFYTFKKKMGLSGSVGLKIKFH
jgi:hypothetical protein